MRERGAAIDTEQGGRVLSRKVVKGLLIGVTGEVVAHLGIKFGLMSSRINGDFLGDAFESLEVGGWVAIAKGVVSDNVETLFEEGLE
jgi:hypothetical protein